MIKCFLLAALPALFFYTVSFILLSENGYQTEDIVRDPAQQKDFPSLIGFLSNVGNFLWISASAICLFCLFTNQTLSKHRKELIFLTGLLGIVLAVDDFFLIHDRYVNQTICYAFYILMAAFMIIRHFKTIMSVDGFAFLFAFGCLGLSIFIDMIQQHLPVSWATAQIFEEGFKFIGAAGFVYYAGKICAHKEIGE